MLLAIPKEILKGLIADEDAFTVDPENTSDFFDAVGFAERQGIVLFAQIGSIPFIAYPVNVVHPLDIYMIVDFVFNDIKVLVPHLGDRQQVVKRGATPMVEEVSSLLKATKVCLDSIEYGDGYRNIERVVFEERELRDPHAAVSCYWYCIMLATRRNFAMSDMILEQFQTFCKSVDEAANGELGDAEYREKVAGAAKDMAIGVSEGLKSLLGYKGGK